MMRRLFFGLLATMAVAVLPQAWAAEEAKRPGPPWRPDPEALFNRLDKNHDGVISEDEISPNLPEPMREMLRRADKKGDKKITLDELRDAMKEFRPRPPAERSPGEEGRRHRPGPAGPPERGQREGRHEGPARPPFDLKALFERLDKNKDGSLSFEEFAEGMKEVHKSIMERLQRMGRGSWAGGPRRHLGGWGGFEGFMPGGWGGFHHGMYGGPGGWGGFHHGMYGGPGGWAGFHHGMYGGPGGWAGFHHGMYGGPGGREGPRGAWGGPMARYAPHGPGHGGPGGWWGHAAQFPLAPMSPGHHFGEIFKKLFEGAERTPHHPETEHGPPHPGFRPPFGPHGPGEAQELGQLHKIHEELEELEKHVKALEAKLNAAETKK